jgi:glycosyltransferase involved in cell wall biosynthesis
MRRPRAILMLVFNQVGRGTYWRAFHLGRQLARAGHRVTLVAMARRARLRFATHSEEGMQIVAAPDMLWGPLRSGWDPWESLRRCMWLQGRPFDLVHAFECRPTVLVPALYAHRAGAALVLDWCDWFGRGGSVEERANPLVRAVLRPVETFFEERFRTRADGTTVICSTLHQKAIALGVPPETILPLRDGADVEGIVPGDQAASRAALGLPATAPIVGYVGAIFPRDATLMAAAFDQIRQRQPTARLLLIGYVNARIESLVRDPTAILSSGPLGYPDLSRYLAACDLCWLPYHDSGAGRGRWPLKLNDYMAAGRPTVASAVGDVADVLRAHDIGLLARPTPEDLASKALELLGDSERRERQGRMARAVAVREFDWRLRAARLEEFYERTLARRVTTA